MFDDYLDILRQGMCEAVPTLCASSGGITNPAIGALGDSPSRAASGLIFLYYFVYLWRVIMTVGAIFVLIYFIWAAIEWINAGGDASKVQKARDRIVQSFIGLILLVFSFVIVNFIGTIFFAGQFNILDLSIPTLGD